MKPFLLFVIGLLLLVGCAGSVTTAVTPASTTTMVPIPVTAVPLPTTTAVLATAVVPLATPVPATAATLSVNVGTGTANADVLFVRAVQTAATTWTFHVTVSHPDSGWEDYADGWDVVLPDETVLKPDAGSPFTRLLLHPHETEQPFTRSQGGLEIPADTLTVRVRAHDLVDGFGGNEVILDWEAAVSGTNLTTDHYEIIPLPQS